MKDFVTAVTNTSNSVKKIYNAAIARISSIASSGMKVNVVNHNNSELRDVTIPLPYGISSSALDDIAVHVVIHDGRAAMMGVYDPNRPKVKPGEVIVYSKYGSYIKLGDDGNVTLVSASGISLTVDQIYQHMQHP